MKKVYTINQAYTKAARYCAYQERTQQEVREKIYAYGLYSDEAEEVIARLIEDNFINEERFAQAFAGGKFRLKKWGRAKIEHALREKGISDYCVRKGLEQIDPEDYLHTLQELLEKNAPFLKKKTILPDVRSSLSTPGAKDMSMNSSARP